MCDIWGVRGAKGTWGYIYGVGVMPWNCFGGETGARDPTAIRPHGVFAQMSYKMGGFLGSRLFPFGILGGHFS